MKMNRNGGILLHVTALPDSYGIGSLGKETLDFIEYLARADIKLWQICPLGPTGYGNSPYQCYSAFAGNTLLIDLQELLKQGLIEKTDVPTNVNFAEDRVEFDKVHKFKMIVLEKAFQNFQADSNIFRKFCREQSIWLDDYCLFMALKENYDGKSWLEWPENIKLREPEAVNHYKEKLADRFLFHKFMQFIFFEQWQRIKEYANKNGVEIIGDIPIYVAADSADVWTNPALFQLDEEKNPLRVAGYPPDAFSPTGQFWGNPLFDWEKHKETNYDWWKDRIQASLDMYDMLRLDHFLGFVRYWSIPAGDKTAENGEWIEGPKEDIFQALQDHFGSLPIIAEDLGNITPDVTALREKFKLPGMKILQFAFDGNDDNPYLPKNVESRAVIYTGTHDNETSEGWYKNLPEKIRKYCDDHIGKYNGEKISWKMIEAIWDSRANFAIAPMQDFLGLDNSARFNTPGTLGNNWEWRLQKQFLSEDLNRKIRQLNLRWDR